VRHGRQAEVTARLILIPNYPCLKSFAQFNANGLHLLDRSRRKPTEVGETLAP
jgi:hypothetical protein